MQQYHHEVDQLIDHLQHPPDSQEILTRYQQQLDHLAQEYQANETLGAERHKLYQAQAMISYWQNDFTKARQFIQQAVQVRGSSYKLAEELLAHLGPETITTPRPYKRWWFLIIGPVVALLVIALLQIVSHFVFTTVTSTDGLSSGSSTHPVALVINILSIVVGIAAVICLLFLPVWIIMLLKAKRYNQTGGYSLSKTIAIVLAVVVPPFYWLYTYERDKTKFWLNLGLSVITFGWWGIVAWIWGIIEAANHSDAYYEHFPKLAN